MKTNVTNWIIDNIENGKLDEEQVVVVYDKNNNIEYLGKAQFAPLNLWDEFKTAVKVGNELRINERQTIKKPVSMKIVGLNYDKVFYQIKINNEWKQFTKSVGLFIHMMYVLFPDIMKQAKPYCFYDTFALSNWLYNYGYENGETYIFTNN